MKLMTILFWNLMVRLIPTDLRVWRSVSVSLGGWLHIWLSKIFLNG